MSLPSNLTMTSPASMPAGLPGPLSSTPATSAPRTGLMPRLSAISSVTCWILTPSQPRRTSPNCWKADPPTALHGLGGHGEADADRTARGRDDRGVDTDHLAVEVEQRPARIAAIDGGIGLDVVVVRPRIDVAVARRDDAGRHRAAQAERITDRHRPIRRAGACRCRRTSPTRAACPALTRSTARSVFRSRPTTSTLSLRAVREESRVISIGLGDDVVVRDYDAGRRR